MKLLVHADPGARGALLAAWLTDRLDQVAFDVGRTIWIRWKKIHRLERREDIESFEGTKIRIRPTLETIDLVCLLFLRKNVFHDMPTFTRDEYDYQTFEKLVHFAQEVFDWDSELDYSLYDHVIEFKHTFDVEFMKALYQKINHREAPDKMVDILVQINNLNAIAIDKNHASSIVKLILTRETELGLRESDRLWSIVDIYQTRPRDQLYDSVSAAIHTKNYSQTS